MKKYEVDLFTEASAGVVVEANSEEEAKDKAIEMVEGLSSLWEISTSVADIQTIINEV